MEAREEGEEAVKKAGLEALRRVLEVSVRLREGGRSKIACLNPGLEGIVRV